MFLLFWNLHLIVMKIAIWVDFNFIQDDSPPAQTLIAPSSYQKSKNEEDKMAWLSKFCDKNISQSSLSEKFQIGDFFDENWAKDIDVTCLNKLS